MFKLTIFLCVLIASVAAIPSGVAPLSYSAPLVAPGFVTARSSQVIARNYNGIAAAPYVAAPASYVAAAPLAYSAPAVASVSHGPVAFAPAVRAAAPLKYTAYF